MTGVILAVLIEYIIFVYYLNSAENMKMSKVRINIITACIYALYAIVCVASHITMLNVILFFVMNVILLFLGWRRSILFNMLNGVILTVFMMFSELLIGLVFNIGVGNSYISFTIAESYILSAFSKLIYFICVMFLRRFTITDVENISIKEEIMFLLLPIATCVFFSAYAKIRLQVDSNGHTYLMFASILLIVANVLVYLVYNMVTDKNIRIRKLAEIEHKREIEYSSYELLKERYDDLKMMIHDFEKYCNNIEGLIETDPDKARSEIKCIRNKNKTLLLVEHTNNKALNVILDQKMRECTAKEIDFKINIQHVDLSFINELDTVTIFANLFDNAIEGCESAQTKTIEVEIFIMNESYTAIRIVNTCGIKPESSGGWFVTRKKNRISHGIGLKSVQRTLDKYDAKMKCSYEQETGTFNVIILINNSKK